jgi:hypothetical protein
VVGTEATVLVCKGSDDVPEPNWKSGGGACGLVATRGAEQGTTFCAFASFAKDASVDTFAVEPNANGMDNGNIPVAS